MTPQFIESVKEKFCKTFGITIKVDDAYRAVWYSLKAKDISDWWIAKLTEAYQLGQKERDGAWRKEVEGMGKKTNRFGETLWNGGYNKALSDLLNKMK